MSFLKLKEPESYLSISEGKKGLEFFFDKDISKLPYVLRRTIVTYLTMAIAELQSPEDTKPETKK